MRRAGFGASHEETDELSEQSYEETVEQLLSPETQPDYDTNLLYRYHPMAEMIHDQTNHSQIQWMYRMVNGHRPLQEKMCLFWHHVFATGLDKVENGTAMLDQIQIFRSHGMGNFRDILIQIAKNPAMIYWLDNQENHKRAPNENWGRELLELFSLGVGHYTEKDVFECARAFTGWTFVNRFTTGFNIGPIPWEFVYKPEDHDNGTKTFLGITGNLNGEDIIDIILKQPACASFITRHLYNFFVADEPEVPKWPNEPPQDPQAVELLSKIFVNSGYEIKPVLRAMFKANFFKEAVYKKVKSPVEVVIGTLKLTGDLTEPDPRWHQVVGAPASMGQDLMNPPSVEGWHTGKEWINSGSLINRVNFTVDRLRNTDLPGVRIIIDRISRNSKSSSPESIVDCCLEELGSPQIETDTYKELISTIKSKRPLQNHNNTEPEFAHLVSNILSLIAGTTEYQFC